MIVMALIYIFGIVSGVLLTAMILAAWIGHASRKLREHQPTIGSRAYASPAPVARNYTHRHSRRHRTVASNP